MTNCSTTHTTREQADASSHILDGVCVLHAGTATASQRCNNKTGEKYEGRHQGTNEAKNTNFSS